MATTDFEQLPDLVRDTELETSFRDGLTIHTYREAAHRAALPRMEVWERVQELGFGGNGRVWLEECTEGQKTGGPSRRAIKEIRLRHRSHAVDYRRELDALAKFSQDKFATYFARSFGWFRGENIIYLALEYFELGDLHDYLSGNPQIFEKDIQEVVFQILKGLEYMHSEGFAHRDLKPENVLIRSKPPNNWWIKLTDFGLTRRITTVAGLSSQLGTQGYAAPEILWPFIVTGHHLEELPQAAVLSTDIWSLGEIAFRMWTGGKPSFKTEGQLLDYSRGLSQFPESALLNANTSPLAALFITSVMAMPYSSRLTVKSALGHEWMTAQGSFGSTIEPNSNTNELKAQVTHRTIDTDTTSRGWTTPLGSMAARSNTTRTGSIIRKPLSTTAKLVNTISTELAAGPTLVTDVAEIQSPSTSASTTTPVSLQPSHYSSLSDSSRDFSTTVLESIESISAEPVKTHMGQKTSTTHNTKHETPEPALTGGSAEDHGETVNGFHTERTRTEAGDIIEAQDFSPKKAVLLEPIPRQEWLPLSGAQRSYPISNLLSDEPNFSGLSISQPSTIWHMAISPDATYLASISNHGLHVFNLDTRSSFNLLQGNEKAISRWTGICFSPDSNWIAAVSYTNNILVWKLSDPSSLRVLKGHLTKVYSIAFSPDSRSIISSSDDRQLIWSLGGHILDSCHFRRNLIFLCFLGSRTKLLGVSIQGKAYIWSLSSAWRIVQKQDVGISSVSAVSLSPNLNYIAAVSGKELAFCSLDKSVNTAIYQFEDKIDSVAFDSKSIFVALTLQNKTLRIFSPIHGSFDALDFDIQLPWAATSYTSVSLSKEKDWITVATSDATADLLDLSKLVAYMYIRCYTRKLQQLPSTIRDAEHNSNQKPCISSDGLKAVSWYNQPPLLLDNSLKYIANVFVWDVQTADVFLFEALDGHYASSTFSSDSQRIAIVLRDNTVQVWHLKSHTCEIHVRMADPNVKISTPVFSADLTYVAFTRTNSGPPQGCHEPHSILCLFRLGKTYASTEIELGGDDLQSMAFAVDGSMLALLTNTERGKVGAFSIAYNPGALRLRIFCLNGLQADLWKVIDVLSDDSLTPFFQNAARVSAMNSPPYSDVISRIRQKVVFSSNGTQVAILSTTNEMEIWDIAKSSLVRRYQWTKSNRAAVHEPVLSPDWKYLAVNAESEIRILDMPSMKILGKHEFSERGRIIGFTENSQFLLLEHVPSATWFSVPGLKPLITGSKASIGYINDLKSFVTIKRNTVQIWTKDGENLIHQYSLPQRHERWISSRPVSSLRKLLDF